MTEAKKVCATLQAANELRVSQFIYFFRATD